MKRFIALLLAMVLVVALVACGNKDKVKKFVDKYGEEFSAGVAEGFSSSGMTCKATMTAKDDGVVVKIRVDNLDDVDATTKAAVQSSLSASTASFKESLTEIQKKESAVKFMELQLCEEDGDLIAKVTVR